MAPLLLKYWYISTLYQAFGASQPMPQKYECFTFISLEVFESDIGLFHTPFIISSQGHSSHDERHWLATLGATLFISIESIACQSLPASIDFMQRMIFQYFRHEIYYISHVLMNMPTLQLTTEWYARARTPFLARYWSISILRGWLLTCRAYINKIY